jgi:hypothetical protein
MIESTIDNNITDSTVEEVGDIIVKGQPGLVMLPARMYEMKTVVSSHTFSIPIAGKFSELYPDFFEMTKKVPEMDVFETVFYVDEKSCLASVAIVEVLFAAKKYPDLKDNQVFSISTVVADKKNNLLHIIGTVFEIAS